MATLFVRHTVSDYTAWRKGYDDFDATRKSMGVTSHAVYQLDGNPNDITAYHEFDSMDAAKAFAGSSELREAMTKAGVVGAPQVWLAQRT
jgi:quinol monooxygenase YgiN